MQRNGSLDRYWSTDLKALCSLSLRWSNFTDFHTHALYVKYALGARCKADPTLRTEYFLNPLDSHVHPGKGPQKMFGKGREVTFKADQSDFSLPVEQVSDSSMLVVGVRRVKALPPLGETRRAAIFSLNFGQSQLRLKRKHLDQPKKSL